MLQAEELGTDAVFGYYHFHKPFVTIVNGGPELDPDQPDVNNFEGWTGQGEKMYELIAAFDARTNRAACSRNGPVKKTSMIS